jgi:glyceraldehyde-3-phosphate dehydrogenase type I
MPIKVGINGFGRIGRHVLRIGLERPDLQFVAINDISDAKTLAHLFKYDSVFGPFKGEIKVSGNSISINGKKIRVFSEREPQNISWNEIKAQQVVEATGIFTSKEAASMHMGGSVKKVIITAPSKGAVDFSTVMGVNDKDYRPSKHHILSNASCTTNCFSMLVKVLHDSFGIKRGQMTTIHSYTNDQRILDAPHKDLRRARSAALSIIPTSTGAANLIQVIFPELKGKLEAVAMRVPTPDVSVVDFVAELKTKTTIEQVNDRFKKASKGKLNGYLRYTDEPIVSSDLIGDTHSAIFDSQLTSMVGGNLIKVIAWYDNEYGYSSRVVDLIELVGKKL